MAMRRALWGCRAPRYFPACSVRLVRVRSRVDEKAHAREPRRENRRHGSTAAHYSEGVVMAKVTLMKREPTHLQIAHRAFESYVSRGAEHSDDIGDWFEEIGRASCRERG